LAIRLKEKNILTVLRDGLWHSDTLFRRLVVAAVRQPRAATFESPPNVTFRDVVAASCNASCHSCNCEISRRHLDEVNNRAVPGGLPAADARQIGARRQGGLHRERTAGKLRGSQPTEKLATGGNWFVKLGPFQTNLVGVQEGHPRVNQRQKLTGERRLPRAIGSRHDDCLRHGNSSLIASRRAVNSELLAGTSTLQTPQDSRGVTVCAHAIPEALHILRRRSLFSS
jgi:hypothetical protein